MSRTCRTRATLTALAAALALAAPSGAALAKSQYAKQCKPAANTGSATPILHPNVASIVAAKIWSSEVTSSYGTSWASWSTAIAKSVQCRQQGVPTRVICVASARPCRYVIQATETHPPYPGLAINIGIGGIGIGRPPGIHRPPGIQRPPRGLDRPRFFGGAPIGRRPR
jgi:hypothetical protein